MIRDSDDVPSTPSYSSISSNSPLPSPPFPSYHSETTASSDESDTPSKENTSGLHHSPPFFAPTTYHNLPTAVARDESIPTFKLVGDNIYKTVKPREEVGSDHTHMLRSIISTPMLWRTELIWPSLKMTPRCLIWEVLMWTMCFPLHQIIAPYRIIMFP